MYKTLKKTDSFAKAVWANSPLPSDTSFQPGGTSIVVFGKLASRVKTTGQDPLGRWSYVILEGKDGKEIIVISVYQSCKTTNDGINTFHTQQKILLSLQNKTDITPRANFTKDLNAFIQSCKDTNPNIIPIVMGDWNEQYKTGASSYDISQKHHLIEV